MMALADVDLVLASTSPYRRELLSRLSAHFRCLAPQVDEAARPGEAPSVLAARLAAAKAHEVAARTPGAVVIGSDQVADLDGTVLGKPGSIENARAQLAACSGHDVVFHTAICLVDARVAPAQARSAMDSTKVRFRQLDAQEIARYIERELPLDCAGSFKAEALGIALFEQIESVDPTALIGLPLIALNRLLREIRVAVV
jgi:septum formation protein